MTRNICRHTERSEESVWGEYFRWFKTQPADSTLRLRLCRSVGNLLLTSSLALLDSTLPKIRQNDGKYRLNGLYLITSANHRIYRNREEIAVNLKKREEKTT